MTGTKALKYILGIVISLVLLGGAFSGGILVGWAMPNRFGSLKMPIPAGITGKTETTPSAAGATPSAKQNLSQSDMETLFVPFWDTWKIVHNQFVDQPVDDEKMMRGAIRGMLDSLGDQHTSYMDPDQFRQQNAPLQGEYEGIGAWVDITGEYLTITGPMPNSPAEKAGLKSGDKVIGVDGEDMKGIDGNLVLRKVLGPAGTKVKLQIAREGEKEPLTFEIERAKINVPSVTGKMLDNNIAYLQIYTFGEKTNDEVRKELKPLMDKNPKGLILDLRNNGGGYLNTAIDIVSEFIDGNRVAMYEQFGDGTRKTFKTSANGIATKIPLVVLVNKGTASASEITAGAIQDYGRGILIGTTTFGKGSVQNWIPLANEQGAVRVTIARWLTPKERLIHKIGLKPDITLELTEEDVKSKNDRQLQRAIDYFVNGQ
jgi:carboxyl-terminal processing protease